MRGRVGVSVGAHVIRWHTSYKLFVYVFTETRVWNGLVWPGLETIESSNQNLANFIFHSIGVR